LAKHPDLRDIRDVAAQIAAVEAQLAEEQR